MSPSDMIGSSLPRVTKPVSMMRETKVSLKHHINQDELNEAFRDCYHCKATGERVWYNAREVHM
jgi:hypothetical protein